MAAPVNGLSKKTGIAKESSQLENEKTQTSDLQIGRLLSESRRGRGITQSDLARKLSVTQAQVSRWESGNEAPTISQVKKLSAVLGLDVAAFVFLRDSSQSEVGNIVVGRADDDQDVPPPVGVRTKESRAEELDMSKKIFIVHGHNELVVQTTARLVERLGLEPIILSEQANSGQTLMEKFEKNSDVGFAIILMTADDKGGANAQVEKGSFSPRARQNVVLELGYFVGKLGRERVCVLKESGVEEPSDIHGIVYTPIDNGNSWKYELAKELRAAGYDADSNKI